jgi:hypothetical protein
VRRIIGGAWADDSAGWWVHVVATAIDGLWWADSEARGNAGSELSLDNAACSRSISGMLALQQSSALPGTRWHLPFLQQSAASRVLGELVKQSSGRRSSTIAARLSSMRVPRCTTIIVPDRTAGRPRVANDN